MLRHQIHRTYVTGFVADLSFSALESRLKNIWIRCHIRLMRVDGSRIRKENVVDSIINGFAVRVPTDSFAKYKFIFVIDLFLGVAVVVT